MARQTRSKVTRQKIIYATVDVFSEVGYRAAGLGAIVERAGMTKGALYHHFDSLESLASAVIDEGSELLINALDRLLDSSSPAMENLVHSTFVITCLLSSDKVVSTSVQLVAARGQFNESAARAYAHWLAVTVGEAKRAIAEGDLRPDLDPTVVGESIFSTMLGVRLLARTADDRDLIGRLRQTWELLLPALVTEESLPYFREFIARAAVRNIP